jgi:hypothetical protein
VEGDGFELSVPRVMGGRFRTTGTIAVFKLAGTAVALQRGTKVWDRQALSHSSISGTATAHVKSSNTATVASAALTAFFPCIATSIFGD